MPKYENKMKIYSTKGWDMEWDAKEERSWWGGGKHGVEIKRQRRQRLRGKK